MTNNARIIIAIVNIVLILLCFVKIIINEREFKKMEIYNPPQQVPFLTCATGQKLQCYIFEIGDWNMDAFNSTTVAHGLGALYKNIRSVDVIIRNDADNNYTLLNRGWDAADPNLSWGGVKLIWNTSVDLWRRTGSDYDHVDYDSTSYNRGWVVLWVQA